MALTVEDGTGLGDADAFVSLAYADSYHTDRGNATWTGTDAEKEEAIRRATEWLSAHFTWKGRESHGRDQALSWPRAWVTDDDGWGVEADVVPPEVQKATAEAALRELVTPGFFTPDVTLTDRVKAERVGPISTEYFAPGNVDAARPVVTLISDMLRGLTRGSGGFSGRAVRA